jgi:hypothetical protein
MADTPLVPLKKRLPSVSDQALEPVENPLGFSTESLHDTAPPSRHEKCHFRCAFPEMTTYLILRRARR